MGKPVPAPDPDDIRNTTAELIVKVRDGDRSAENEIVRRNLPDLRRYAHGRLPHSAREGGDTDDLVQETMLKALPRLGTFDSQRPGALQSYLRVALKNRVTDAVRRSIRRPPGDPLVEVADSGPSPADVMSLAADRGQLPGCPQAAAIHRPAAGHRARRTRMELGADRQGVRQAQHRRGAGGGVASDAAAPARDAISAVAAPRPWPGRPSPGAFSSRRSGLAGACTGLVHFIVDPRKPDFRRSLTAALALHRWSITSSRSLRRSQHRPALPRNRRPRLADGPAGADSARLDGWLERLPMVHFASIQAFSGEARHREGCFQPCLVFESCIDGSVADYLDALVATGDHLLAEVFAPCADFKPEARERKAYLRCVSCRSTCRPRSSTTSATRRCGSTTSRRVNGCVTRSTSSSNRLVSHGRSLDPPRDIVDELRQRANVPPSSRLHWHAEIEPGQPLPAAWYADPVPLLSSRLLNWSRWLLLVGVPLAGLVWAWRAGGWRGLAIANRWRRRRAVAVSALAPRPQPHAGRRRPRRGPGAEATSRIAACRTTWPA